jgi:hypothetical protein
MQIVTSPGADTLILSIRPLLRESSEKIIDVKKLQLFAN